MNFATSNLICALVVALAGCEAPQVYGSVDNNENSAIEYVRIEPPHPKGTIVFENGSCETSDEWDKVTSVLGKEYTVFLYNRPGYGHSSTTQTARDGKTIEEELHKLLQHQGLRPPYMMVGHSLGGLYVQMFAGLYPTETQGVVLVDALYPGMVKRTDEFPLYVRLAKHLFLSESFENEIDQIHQTGEAVRAHPVTANIPIVQLINDPKPAGGLVVDLGTLGVMDTDPTISASIRTMYSKAKIVVVDSVHAIQVANPEYVISAIRDAFTMAGAR